MKHVFGGTRFLLVLAPLAFLASSAGATNQFPTSALRFAGTASGSYIAVPDSPALDLERDFTIEADVRWDGTNGYAPLVSKPRQDNGNPGSGYALAVADGKPLIGLFTPGGIRVAIADTALPVGVWAHVEVGYTGSVASVRVNGSLVQSVDYGWDSPVVQGSTSLLIGREFLYGLDDRAFHGDVDNVRLSTGVSPAPLTTVAYYPFQERSGLTTADASGNGHTGTLSGMSAPTWIGDRVAPSASATQAPAANAAGWSTSDVTVTWNWADNRGGYGIDDASCAGSTTSTGEGTIPLSATCSDWAGNTARASYTVKVDKTPPTSSASLSPAARNGWFASPTVTLVGDDGPNGSGIERLSYSLDGGAFATYSGPLAGFPTGNHSIRFHAVDAAGWEETTTHDVQFKVDAAGPSVKIRSPRNGAWYALKSARKARFRCNDRASGVASCIGTVANRAQVDTSTPGRHTLTVTAADRAGNVRVAAVHYSVGYTYIGSCRRYPAAPHRDPATCAPQG